MKSSVDQRLRPNRRNVSTYENCNLTSFWLAVCCLGWIKCQWKWPNLILQIFTHTNAPLPYTDQNQLDVNRSELLLWSHEWGDSWPLVGGRSPLHGFSSPVRSRRASGPWRGTTCAKYVQMYKINNFSIYNFCIHFIFRISSRDSNKKCQNSISKSIIITL